VKGAVGALMLGAALLVWATPAAAQKQKKKPRVDSIVEQALQDGRDLPVIVRYASDEAGERVKKGKSGKREFRRHLRGSRAFALKVNHRALREMLDDEGDDIESISYDAPVKGAQLLGTLTSVVDPPHVTVNGSGASAARSRYGVSGYGVTVAVIDSGVRPHADLPATRIRAFVDFVNGRTTPYDDYGHGTHVAGIIAGSGSASAGKYKGVAPSASIVALKVLDGNGSGRTSDVLASLEWVLANHALYNIRIVNLSLGHPVYEPAATDPLVQLVNQLSQRGVVVVVSAGNMGRNSLGQTVYGSITSPGNAQGAVTVGAADTKGTLARSDDGIASFSSRGPTRFERYIKPDVVAPGFQIASLLAGDSTLALKYPTLKIGTSYFRLNGTSQAAPVVSGAAALMLQANASLTAHQVKGILQFTAQRLKGLDIMTQGAGEVNVAGAVRLAKQVAPSVTWGSRWIKGSRRIVQADLLNGETAYWGKAILWGDSVKTDANALYLRLGRWYDDKLWGYAYDNIVWSYADNIVWGYGDNIVWSMLDDNIVWGMTDDNIVWGFDDNIVWGYLDDNIVWGYLDDNIVWGMLDDNIVWGMLDDNIVWGLSADNIVWGNSVDQEGGQ
jgi:serine protease AprX